MAEDYDQLVTVIPKISSTLPLVPLWLAQKILDRNVFDKAFAYQYMITGPWSQPSVELGEDPAAATRMRRTRPPLLTRLLYRNAQARPESHTPFAEFQATVATEGGSRPVSLRQSQLSNRSVVPSPCVR